MYVTVAKCTVVELGAETEREMDGQMKWSTV